MTNEYKLAPKVPTDKTFKLFPRYDDISDHGDGYDLFEKMCIDGGICGGIGEGVITAIEKHAPTVQEVDLDNLWALYLMHLKMNVENPKDDISFVDFVKKEHGKLYAVKGE